MAPDPSLRRGMPATLRLSLAAAALAALAGCATPTPAPRQPPERPSPQQSAERQLQRAMQAAHPRSGNTSRARSLLEGLLAADDEASRALHPYARTLLDQLNERQRLGQLNERLEQQLERSAHQLAESELHAEGLQRKLDALAEIERSLSPRPATALPLQAPPRGAPP